MPIYSQFNFPDLKLLNFYQVFGFDWEHEQLGEGTVVLKKFAPGMYGGDEYKHYVYFLRHAAFECIAKGYEMLSEKI